MEDCIVRAWPALQDLGIGLRLGPTGPQQEGVLYNHCIWADNAIFFAPAAAQLRQFIHILSPIMREVSLHWKPDAFQYLCATAGAPPLIIPKAWVNVM